MDNQKEKEVFSYTYSARQQEEVKRIRSKYLPAEEDKMEQLRRLDAGVTQKATVVSLIAGIIGTLVFGTGMCCCLVWAGSWFIPGIVIGVLGLVLIGLANPLYNRITKRERERIAPEIIRLTDELINGPGADQ